MNRIAVRIYVASAFLSTFALAALPGRAADPEARVAQAASKQDIGAVRSLIAAHASIARSTSDREWK